MTPHHAAHLITVMLNSSTSFFKPEEIEALQIAVDVLEKQ